LKPSYWKRLSSGKYVDIGDLQPDDVSIEDVNTSLNNIYRFTGHHKDRKPLTVAQHSLLCYQLAEIIEPDDFTLHLAVLTHDFAECIIGDVATPVKKAMGQGWRDFAMPIERIFEEKFFGEIVDVELHERVKLYDLMALDIERRIMWESQYGKDKWPMTPLSFGKLSDKKEIFDRVAKFDIDLPYIWQYSYDAVRA
jgi:hypothetical protein